MKILIVDDDRASRRFLYKFLLHYGQCDLAIDGMEALDAYLIAEKEVRPYDLLCLDIMMPKINGIQVLQAIRNFEKKRKIPLAKRLKAIIISVLADSDFMSKATELNVEAYLEKPLDLQEFARKLEELNIKTINWWFNSLKIQLIP